MGLLSRRKILKGFLPLIVSTYGIAAYSEDLTKKNIVIDSDKIKDVLPEMFGAIGDGVADDTESLQKSFVFWLNNPNKPFVGNGIYAVSSPIKVVSPGMCSKGYIHGLKKHPNWHSKNGSVLNSDESLLILDVENEKGSNTWGAYFEVGYLTDESQKSTPRDYHVSGIINDGWQQCEIVIGLAQGLISALKIRNKKQTSPTVHYRIRMARGNLVNYFANNNVRHMYEGCIFETNWSSGGLFGAEILGNGSTYAKIQGGSADFSGQYLMYIFADTIPNISNIGHEVRTQTNDVVGWYLGVRYHPESGNKSIIIGGLKNMVSSNGRLSAPIVKSGDELVIGKHKLKLIDIFCGNNSHSPNRFLPTAICIANKKQKIVRWRIDRDYDSGVIFSSDVYFSDSQVNTTNEAVRRKVPLPLGANFDSSITDGELILNGQRYTTRLQVNNLEIITPGGISTAKHNSVWRISGNSGATILANNFNENKILAFTLKSLGGGTIKGRIGGRVHDPVTDEVGLWDVTGFGTNIDGTVAIDKWNILWNGGEHFYITKLVSGTQMTLVSTQDPSGVAAITLVGGINNAQANPEELWQYRMAALRKFML